MSLNIVELKNQLGQAVTALRKLQDECDQRGGERPEDTESFAKMEAEISGIEKRIQNEEFIANKEAELAKSERQSQKNGNGNGNGAISFDPFRYPAIRMQNTREEHERRVSKTLQGWLRMAKPGGVLEPEHIDCAKMLGIPDLHATQIDVPIIKDYRTFQ